mmetsp:Transcript_21953/g.39212  ORF Transcript_21953/g.39212 Transcript_21953/m.39212 type:complete len:112 (+) Transcript_21953:141-476(+)
MAILQKNHLSHTPNQIQIELPAASETIGILSGIFPVKLETTEYPTLPTKARNTKFDPELTNTPGIGKGSCPSRLGKTKAMSRSKACCILNRTGRGISGFRLKTLKPMKKMN